MTISRHWPPSDREFDVCIVGAGLAGIAVALACETKGLTTLLVEAGGRRPSTWPRTTVEAEIVEPHRHAPLDVATRQAFGGTSWAWGGGCVPLDAIDFEQRPYVSGSGWPLSYKDVGRWHGHAAAYLDCGDPAFSSQAPGWEGLPDVSVDRLQRLARRARIVRDYANVIRKSGRLWVSLHKDVKGLELDATGEQVVGLRIGSSTRGPVPRARAYVLACGGLRTTRLLLDLQTRWPGHFGGKDSALGCFYMGHVVGEIATVVFKAPKQAAQFLFRPDAQGIFSLRHFRINDNRQRADGVLNTVFALRSPPIADQRHESGALSLALLASRLPGVRAALRSERLHTSSSEPQAICVARHVRNVLADPHLSARELARLVYFRFGRRPGVPVIPENRSGRYGLRYHAEQVPSASSRVRLAANTNSAGERHLSVDFKFTDQDTRSVLLAHEILDRSLRQSGKGHLEYWHPPEERLEAIRAMASDGYHQIGTTRMGESPRQSVVDPSCRVHGLKNLFIASSSVFPTSGNANPTFTVAALAIRLAHHLAHRVHR